MAPVAVEDLDRRLGSLELLENLEVIDVLFEQDKQTVKAILDPVNATRRFQRLAVATE